MQNTDLKFFTNEPERDLYSRFSAILASNTASATFAGMTKSRIVDKSDICMSIAEQKIV